MTAIEALSAPQRRMVWRGGLLVVGGALAYLIFAVTTATASARVQPALALSVWPYSVAAKQTRAAVLAMDPAGKADGEALRLAQGALVREPTANVAARVVGMVADKRGRTGNALRAFAYGDALSRRDLVTQLWLIEYFVRRGDVPRVLQHYDAAASTSSDATRLLFPIIVSAVSEKQIIEPLAAMLSRRPFWLPTLLSQVVNNAADRDHAKALIDSLKRRGVPIPDYVQADLDKRYAPTAPAGAPAAAVPVQ